MPAEPSTEPAPRRRREYPEAPIAAVGAVVLDGERVLLIRRGQEPQKGEWSLPGGALELGETLDEGVRREVLEETGLVVEPVRVVAVLDRIVLDEAERVRYHYVLVDSLCRVVGGSLRCASDAVEADWVLRDELGEEGLYRLGDVTLDVIEKAFGA